MPTGAASAEVKAALALARRLRRPAPLLGPAPFGLGGGRPGLGTSPAIDALLADPAASMAAVLDALLNRAASAREAGPPASARRPEAVPPPPTTGRMAPEAARPVVPMPRPMALSAGRGARREAPLPAPPETVSERRWFVTGGVGSVAATRAALRQTLAAEATQRRAETGRAAPDAPVRPGDKGIAASGPAKRMHGPGSRDMTQWRPANAAPALGDHALPPSSDEAVAGTAARRAPASPARGAATTSAATLPALGAPGHGAVMADGSRNASAPTPPRGAAAGAPMARVPSASPTGPAAPPAASACLTGGPSHNAAEPSPPTLAPRAPPRPAPRLDDAAAALAEAAWRHGVDPAP